MSMLPAHIELGVYQDPQVLHYKAAFQPVRPQPMPVQGLVPLQGQDFAFAFVELCEIPDSPFLPGSLGMAQPCGLSAAPPSHTLSFLKRHETRRHLMASVLFMIYVVTDKKISRLWNSFVNVQMSFANQLSCFKERDCFPLKIMCQKTTTFSACNHF